MTPRMTIPDIRELVTAFSWKGGALKEPVRIKHTVIMSSKCVYLTSFHFAPTEYPSPLSHSVTIEHVVIY